MQRPFVLLSALLLAAPASADDGVLRFKFGPAGAKTPGGYRLVTDTDAFAAGKPGWLKTGNLASAERPKGSPLARSFVYANTAKDGGAATFKVDLPAGRYAVVFYAQDLRYGRDETPFDVSANGQKKLGELRVSGVTVESFTAEVAGSGLEIRLAPSAVRRPYNFWLVNAIVIGAAARRAELESELASRVFELRPPSDFQELAPPPTAHPAEPTIADRKQGYQLWSHDWLDLVYPSTLPPAGIGQPRLETIAWPGQTTCLAFSVRAIDDLGAPQVRVIGADGSPQVKIDRVWVRPVRQGSHGLKYIRRPDALLPLATVRLSRWHEVEYRLPAGVSQTYWLTITVPRSARPGLHQSAIEFSPEGRPAAKIPLSVRVLPFTPAEPPQYTGLYWAPGPMEQTETIRQDLANMYAHGARAAAIHPRINVSLAGDKLQVDAADLFAQLEVLKKAGLTGDMPYSNGWMSRSLPGKSLTDAAYEALYGRVIAEVERQITERSLPRILWYPVDEPGNHPDRLAEAKRWLAVIKRVPGARTYCTPNSLRAVFELRELMDVRCIQQLSVTEETIADAKRCGATHYFYTSAYDGDRLPDRLRFLNGVFLFKSQAKALFYWHYQCPAGDPLNDLDGETCDYNLCHPSLLGPIPTLGWEAIREGNNDVALLHCLTGWATRAEASAKPAARSAAHDARRWLAGVLAGFPLDGKKVHEKISPPVAHESFDRWRNEAAQRVGALMAALGAK